MGRKAAESRPAGATVRAYTLETYTWYAPDYHYPLLTIATTTGPGVNTTQVAYSDMQVTGLESVSAQNAANVSFDLFPNPAKDEVNIKYNTPNNENVRICLSDMLGRQAAIITDRYTQGTQQLRRDVETPALRLRFVLAQKIVRQLSNILAPILQRRNGKRNHVQPVVEIGAELPLFD